jgi:cell wall-associated NlpC family hydrolase
MSPQEFNDATRSYEAFKNRDPLQPIFVPDNYPGVSLGENTIDLSTGEIASGPSVAFVPFFSDAEAVQRLRAAAADWRGTPFHFDARAKGKGGGVDCVGLVEEIMAAAGLERFHFKRAPGDNSRHVYNEKILQYLRGQRSDDEGQSKRLAEIFAELPLPEKKKRTAFVHYYEPPFMPGDLIVMKTGRGLYHMPVMLSATAFIHCAFPNGVSEGDILAPNYQDYLVAAFRARSLTR